MKACLQDPTRLFLPDVRSLVYVILNQAELLEKAKEKNIIVYLGTGSGKTFIAAMLMKHMKDKLLGGLQKVQIFGV